MDHYRTHYDGDYQPARQHHGHRQPESHSDDEVADDTEPISKTILGLNGSRRREPEIPPMNIQQVSPSRSMSRRREVEVAYTRPGRPREASNPQHQYEGDASGHLSPSYSNSSNIASIARRPHIRRLHDDREVPSNIRTTSLVGSRPPRIQHRNGAMSTAPYPRQRIERTSDLSTTEIETLRHPSRRQADFERGETSTVTDVPSPRSSFGANASTFAPPSVRIRPSPNRLRYHNMRGKQFRLLYLLPGTTSAIRCEMVTTSLRRHEKYVAISYAWGDSNGTTQVVVNGCSVVVTSSLYGVLKVLRKKTEAVVLWADALCINQRNKVEQSYQVQLMSTIYSQADSVIVWLGPEAERSELAIELLQEVSKVANEYRLMRDLIASKEWEPHFTALVALFKRDYWRRLWVVQEVLNAKSVTVYCGGKSLSWKAYINASRAFKRHEFHLKKYFPPAARDNDKTRLFVSQKLHNYSAVLCYHGPVSIGNLRLGRDVSLLEALRRCRSKLASNPQDKVYAVLGILPEEVRHGFRTNYIASLKEVYIYVVDFLLRRTRRLDVICEAIYNSTLPTTTNLPSWVPDWSHIPAVQALGHRYKFSASRETDVQFTFSCPYRRTKLEITAIDLDTIWQRSIAVEPLSSIDNFLMAFLHWRAKVLDAKAICAQAYANQVDEAFCRTLCLGRQSHKTPTEWVKVCYHMFSSLIRVQLSFIQLDDELQQYADLDMGIEVYESREMIQRYCEATMTSRCFFITDGGLMGTGPECMKPDDIVCVPFGCSTPIAVRPQGNNEYRYIGDVYVDGYMYGRAVFELEDEKKNPTRTPRVYERVYRLC
ncbi:heterokaryon incompatibility protein-domain-containing protein [Whalleya microplaca]|nr:heterokaryon incompatibility protein-domain-containing protein [Whalleya microplaca]